MHAAGIVSRENAKDEVTGMPLPRFMPIRRDGVLA